MNVRGRFTIIDVHAALLAAPEHLLYRRPDRGKRQQANDQIDNWDRFARRAAFLQGLCLGRCILRHLQVLAFVAWYRVESLLVQLDADLCTLLLGHHRAQPPTQDKPSPYHRQHSPAANLQRRGRSRRHHNPSSTVHGRQLFRRLVSLSSSKALRHKCPSRYATVTAPRWTPFPSSSAK